MSIIERVAASLDLQVVQVASGGEFGAAYVLDEKGDRLVLKATPGSGAMDGWRRGARLAGVMRASGYPAPTHRAIGTLEGATWSLQEVLPGELPETLTLAHLDQLLHLAGRHADRAPEPNQSWAEDLRHRSVVGAQWLAQRSRTRSWGTELGSLVATLDLRGLRASDVVHDDFHHRNYLCDGDAVTGVFDWEGAVVGDWRFDLATLAFWSGVDYARIDDEAGRQCLNALNQHCGASELAFFGTCLTVRVLGFFEATHPEMVAVVADLIEDHVAPWWR